MPGWLPWRVLVYKQKVWRQPTGSQINHRGGNLISDALPFGRLWYDGPNAAAYAIGYAKHRCRSHDARIRVYDDALKISKIARSAYESGV
jgi:hypothetical protein